MTDTTTQSQATAAPEARTADMVNQEYVSAATLAGDLGYRLERIKADIKTHQNKMHALVLELDEFRRKAAATPLTAVPDAEETATTPTEGA